jgi:hypothetical protein
MKTPLFPCLFLLMAGAVSHSHAADSPLKQGQAGGYFMLNRENVEETFDAGFSFYTAAWPLQASYPGRAFQSGLFGTWLSPQADQPPPDGMKLYTKIEGGLGWWRNTEFATTTPKFIMGGVGLNFSDIANGPGMGKGTWENPQGLYGVAQLSNRLLFPPDGLNLKQGTCGELFGYGYLPLPLAEAKSRTAGQAVPTGSQCWTLFLGTGNFKGPVAFFMPGFWSRATVKDPRLAGMFFDSRPSRPNKPISMETQTIRCMQASDTAGKTYLRLAETQFPAGPDGKSVVLHRHTVYNRSALWDGVKRWFEGGPPVAGAIDPNGSRIVGFKGRGRLAWRVKLPGMEKEEQAPLETDFVTTSATDPATLSLEWDMNLVRRKRTEHGGLMVIPEYYRFDPPAPGKDGPGRWIPLPATAVPAETKLADASFERPAKDRPSEPKLTPDDPASCWKSPGPKAGPFRAEPGDGTVVTYYWYRFADQPALLNADMTPEERERMQQRVEAIHRHWPIDRNYLAPPTVGKPADLAPALIVTPPKGMEIGYVPIATKQAYP